MKTTFYYIAAALGLIVVAEVLAQFVFKSALPIQTYFAIIGIVLIYYWLIESIRFNKKAYKDWYAEEQVFDEKASKWLSEDEITVLKLLQGDFTVQEMDEILQFDEQQIITFIQSIRKKLSVKTDQAAIEKAEKLGILRLK